jgi:exopolysaccharide biosynthesis polyprenyl glycosylphosphotransferase
LGTYRLAPPCRERRVAWQGVTSMPDGAKSADRRRPPAHTIPAYRVTVALVVGDALAAVVSYIIAAAIVFGGFGFARVAPGPAAIELMWIVVLWPASFALFGLYQRKIDLSVIDTWPRIVSAASLATMGRLTVVLFAGGVLGIDDVDRYKVSIAAWALAIVLIPIARWAVRYVQRNARAKGYTEKRTLIIGAGHVGTLLADKMLRRPALGLKPIGFLDPDPMPLAAREPMGLPVYRDVDQLERILRDQQVTHVLVAFSTEGFMRAFDIIERCANHGVEVSIVPRFFEISASEPRTDEIEGIPIMTLQRTRFSPALAATKRAIDLVLGGVAMLVALPVMAAVAIAIRSEDGLPVLYRQERLGKDGKPFIMFKFRSMVMCAEEQRDELADQNEATGPIFKMNHDPRVTRVGKFIRRFSFDELPQIFNVMRGDMSLVGPRPPLPSEVEEYGAWECRRLGVVPGITGLWQVLGRSELTFEEMVSLDLNYIWNWSPWLDIQIMARTIGAVLHGRGAY